MSKLPLGSTTEKDTDGLPKIEGQPVGRFGVYDTKDNCWLGDENGPKVFTRFLLARIAAQVYGDQLGLGTLCTRFEARALPEKDFKLKDELPIKRSTLESIIRCESY